MGGARSTKTRIVSSGPRSGSLRNFLSFYLFSCQNFDFLSISQRNFWIFIYFHAKFFNFYHISCEIFQFLSLFMRKSSNFINFHAKFLYFYLFSCEIFELLSIFMRKFLIFTIMYACFVKILTNLELRNSKIVFYMKTTKIFFTF